MTDRCEFHADALVALARGELEPAREPWLAGHLAECAECREELRVARMLLRHPAPVPAGLEESIRATVLRPSSPATRPRGGARRWAPIAVPLAAAAAAAVLWLGPFDLPGTDRDGAGPVAAAPYGEWPASGGVIAGDVVLSELSIEELELLLREMES